MVLILSIPSQILLALIKKKKKNKTFSRIVQSITYMPHFISIVVICSMIIMLTSRDGAITAFLSLFGFEKQTMLNRPDLFLPIYIISNIWQNVGWGSIIFLSALTGIDPGLYEAAKIDGAGHITILVRIVLPLSKAILAVMVLYYGVSIWNGLFWASAILRDRDKYPLQLILREILLSNDSQAMSSGAGGDAEALSQTIKYATIMVATVPILCVYPFLQKYFVTGVMIGAVKE